MTLHEAEAAAENFLPVSCKILISAEVKRIPYARITKTGYYYSAKGNKVPFVELYDVSRHSVTYAKPEDCETIKEQNE